MTTDTSTRTRTTTVDDDPAADLAAMTTLADIAAALDLLAPHRVCRRGHDCSSPDAIYITKRPNKPPGSCWTCKVCRLMTASAYYRTNMAALIQNVCKGGHRRTLANTKQDSLGRQICLDCQVAKAAARAVKCIHGHKMTPENTKYVVDARYPDTPPRAQCRTCRRRTRKVYRRREAVKQRQRHIRYPVEPLRLVLRRMMKTYTLGEMGAMVALSSGGNPLHEQRALVRVLGGKPEYIGWKLADRIACGIDYHPSLIWGMDWA